MGQTSIEWTEHSFNPVVGCTKASLGCANCYALRMAVRLAHNPKLSNDVRERYASTVRKVGGKWEWSGKVALFPKRLDEPLRRRKPTRYFVPSMGDLFHKDVPEDYIVDVFARMLALTEHTFQVLTKRPERMRDFVTRRVPGIAEWSNIWLGITVENKAETWRIDELRHTPAAIRFVSFEPLLDDVAAALDVGHEQIDWAIVGGESGPGARPMRPSHARALREWALYWGIPFFFKQWGAWAPYVNHDNRATAWHWFDWDMKTGDPPSDPDVHRLGKKAAGRLLDGRTWDEMPGQEPQP